MTSATIIDHSPISYHRLHQLRLVPTTHYRLRWKDIAKEAFCHGSLAGREGIDDAVVLVVEVIGMWLIRNGGDGASREGSQVSVRYRYVAARDMHDLIHSRMRCDVVLYRRPRQDRRVASCTTHKVHAVQT